MRALAVVLAAFGLLAAGASAQRGWQKGAPMPSRRSEVAVVAGFGFDLASGRWVQLPDLPTPRHGMAVAAVGSRVYAIGGSPVADYGFSSANEFLDTSS